VVILTISVDPSVLLPVTVTPRLQAGSFHECGLDLIALPSPVAVLDLIQLTSPCFDTADLESAAAAVLLPFQKCPWLIGHIAREASLYECISSFA
jgi:hypothetical protein